MEGHHNFEASMMGMPKGESNESKMEKPENGPNREELAGDIGHRGELAGEVYDGLSSDNEQAKKILLELKDSPERDALAQRLAELEEKKKRIPDPRKIAEGLVKQFGEEYFKPVETPTSELN